MRKLIVRMNMSLDGYVEGPRGAMDWFSSGDEHWRNLFVLLEDTDTFVVGRGMYAGYAEHWIAALTSPTASADERAFAERAQRTRHVVVSRTMQHAELLRTTIARDLDAVARLKEEPGKSIVVWGGATLASALISAGLVDELQLLIQPIVLGGGGKALFEGVARQRLTLAEARAFGTGVLLVRYRSS
jgi:dihydrofolate reductase